MAHQEFGVRLLERVRKDLEQHAIIEQFPRLEGRQMVMVLGPKKKVVPVKGGKPEGTAAPREAKADLKADAKSADAKKAPAKPAAAG
jgi:translation initiation factor IF-3